MAQTNDDFLPATISDVKIEEHDDGPVAVIGDFKVMVIDTILDVQLVQPGHIKENKELKGHAGEFFYKDMELFREELHLLPIGIINRVRRLYPPFDDGDHDLICFSNDGEYPSTKVESPQAMECGRRVDKGDYSVFEVTCPQAIWVDGKKPACSNGINVAFFDLDLKAPIRIGFSGTSMGAWNAFKREYKKYKNIARLKGKNVSDYVLSLTASDEGTYRKVSFAFTENPELTPSQYIPLLGWYRDNLLPRYTPKETPLAGAASDNEAIDVQAGASGDSDGQAVEEPAGGNFTL